MRRIPVCSMVAFACLIVGVEAVRGHDESDRRTYQTANLFQAGNPANQLGGAATLHRSRQRLDVRVAASGLNPNAGYSVWFVVFNRPSACSPPGCGPEDLSNEAVRAAVFYASGFVTGADGTGYAVGYVDAGPLPEGVEVVPDGTVDRLERGRGLRAEVHIVVRTHGMINPGNVHQQVGTFNGACTPTCMNQQVAVFLPID
jgi:hypothetical protein